MQRITLWKLGREFQNNILEGRKEVESTQSNASWYKLWLSNEYLLEIELQQRDGLSLLCAVADGEQWVH